METAPRKKNPFFRGLLALLPSLVFLTIVIVGRAAHFRTAGVDPSRAAYWVPLLIGALGIGVLWWALLRGGQTKAFRATAWTVLVLSLTALVFVCTLPIPWMRFQILRMETLQQDLGISHRKGGLRVELLDELLMPGIGPRITRDHELLNELALRHGEAFRAHPRAAQLVYAGLRSLGTSFDEILPQHGAKEFLSSVLHAEANPKAWVGFEEYPRPDLLKNEALGMHAGLLTREEAKEIIDHERLLAREDTLDYLLYFLISFPTLFSEEEKETLLTEWKGRFPEMDEQIALGFELMEEIRKRAGDRRPLRVYLSVSPALYLSPPEWDDNQMGPTMERTLLGLVRTFVSEVELVPEEQADLVLKAEAAKIKVSEQDVIVYVSETVRVRSGGTMARGVMLDSYRNELRQKPVGTRTQVNFKASVTVEMQGRGEPIVMGDQLFYWHDIIVAANENVGENATAKPVDWGRLHKEYGDRTWPLGFKEDLFRFEEPILRRK